MKQVAIIKDVFRNTPHVIISNDNGTLESKSLTEYGKQIIAESHISENIEEISLPDGFVCTGFKSVTPSMQKIINSWSSTEIKTKSLQGELQSKSSEKIARVFSERHIAGKLVSDRPSAELSIDKFASVQSKINVIDYKARQFKVTSKISSVIAPIKSGKFGFDTTKSVFTSRQGDAVSIFASEVAEKTVPGSMMGRFLSDNNKRNKTTSKRRLARRSRNLSPIMDGSEKPTGKKRISTSIKSRLR